MSLPFAHVAGIPVDETIAAFGPAPARGARRRDGHASRSLAAGASPGLMATRPARSASGRADTENAFLDAAERLLIEDGYARITTRRLAAEAGLNHGLVHYYFGSMEEVFVRALERFTGRLVERRR